MATSIQSSRSTTPRLPHIHPEYSSPGSDYMNYIYKVHASNRISSPTASSRSGKSQRLHLGYNGSGKLPGFSYPQENKVGAQFPVDYYSDGLSKRSKKSVSEVSSYTRQTADIGTVTDMAAELQLDIGNYNPIQRFNSPPSSPGCLPVQSLELPTSAVKSSIRSAKSGQQSSTTSPFKLSFVESPKLELEDEDAISDHVTRWNPPSLSTDEYQNMKGRLLSKGKFKGPLMRYFGLEKPPWARREDSDDEEYDVKLDTQLGFELIADESAKEILKDGAHHDYLKSCRRCRKNPNSYFLRHSMDEDLRMRYRCLSKGDSRSIAFQMKSDMVMSRVDLSDNGIQEKGMRHLSSVLVENKVLTELILARNNLGNAGVKHLKHSLISNCFLLKLDLTDNGIGEKGSKHIAAILEENTTLMDLNISRNQVDDKGITMISKSLANNVGLKILDVGWNNISSVGAVKLCEALKKNTELEILRAKMNGFGEVGGKALVTALRQNNVIREVDLSANRITDPVLKMIGSSLDQLTELSFLQLAGNPISTKVAMDFLSKLMASTTSLHHIDLTGVHVTEEFKGLANALRIVQDTTIDYSDPPAQRELTNDVLTHNLQALCEFMEEEEIEVDDLYPDYEDWDDCDRIMITAKDALMALQCTGMVTQTDKLQRLKSKLRKGRNRKFLVKELALVYDYTICGKDSVREKPLRSHLRHSIKEERAEKERKEKAKASKRYSARDHEILTLNMYM